MGIFANVIPTLKITRRLSCRSNVRHYTSLVQVLQCHRYSNSLLSRNLNLQRFYTVDKFDKPSNRFIKPVDNDKLKGSCSSVLPLALIDLNPSSIKSTKVLLIPLNWQDVDEDIMRNTITSILAKRKHLRQIEAFSEALREISLHNIENINNLKESIETVKQNNELKLNKSKESEEISEKVEEKRNIIQNIEYRNIAAESSQNSQENVTQAHTFENSQDNKEEEEELEVEELTEITVPTRYTLGDCKNSSIVPFSENNIDHLDHLAAAVEIALQKCCLESIQMSVDANLLGQIYLAGFKFCPTTTESGCSEAKDLLALSLSSNCDSLSMASIAIDASELNLEEIGCQKNNKFAEIQSSSLTNITLPINVIRKSFCTNTMQHKLKSPSICTIRESVDSSKLAIPLKRSSHSDMRMAPNEKSTTSKCKANCNLPFLSNLFGAEELLMSCDAYKKALIEAIRRKEAVARSTAQLKRTKHDSADNRQQVMSIKGCSSTDTKADKPCPPPVKEASKGGCKKDDPCKPPQCPNPCKEEMEKLKHNEDAKNKSNKMPTGCVSPKCKKDDSCSKMKKNPCKKPSEHKSAAQVNSIMKQAKDNCKKDDPCNPAECPNPCKEEMEKLKRLKDENAKRKNDKMPTGCISPKCKKDDSCGKLKKSPCKKASEIIKSSSSSQESSTLTVECAKGKDKNNPCSDEHKEYIPKCNKDPCKKDSEPCGDNTKKPAKNKPDHCKKNKNREGDQKKQEPCKKKSTHVNESKKEDSRKEGPKKELPGNKKEKKDPCRGIVEKADPCKKNEKKYPKEYPLKKSPKEEDSKKKEQKKNPCGGNIKKEDPCKIKENKDSFGGGKQRENPCKKKEKKEPSGESNQKKDTCEQKKKEEGPKKGDPSKKEEKNNPYGGSLKKENPCKKKEKKDPCGKSQQKEDPCKKKDRKDSKGSLKKEDPCKKEEKKDPCGGNIKREDSCKKKEKKDICGKPKQKEDPCKKKEKKDPCGKPILKEDSCKKKEKTNTCGKGKQKEDPCKKNEKKDLGGESKNIEDPCKKKGSNPCEDNQKKGKTSPCSSKKKEDPCKKKMSSSPSPCKKSKKKYKSKCKKSPSSSSLGSKKSGSKIPCGKPKRETKPNCTNNKKYFSTLALNAAKASRPKIKCTSLTALPMLRSKNMNSFGFMQHFSSKGGKNGKKNIDHGKQSICKSMTAVIPPKRKAAYNPHPKDGLRKCYPTYDMDCRKLCKEPRQTACNRYSFLKDTDSNKRKGRK